MMIEGFNDLEWVSLPIIIGIGMLWIIFFCYSFYQIMDSLFGASDPKDPEDRIHKRHYRARIRAALTKVSTFIIGSSGILIISEIITALNKGDSWW